MQTGDSEVVKLMTHYPKEAVFESLVSLNNLIESPQIVCIAVVIFYKPGREREGASEWIIFNFPQVGFQFLAYRKVKWYFS